MGSLQWNVLCTVGVMPDVVLLKQDVYALHAMSSIRLSYSLRER